MFHTNRAETMKMHILFYEIM